MRANRWSDAGRCAAAAGALTMLLGGCGSNSADTAPEQTPAVPTASATPPSGEKLTTAGADLGFGDTAVVSYAPNPQRSTVLKLTVVSVQRGVIKDLAAFELDPVSATSTPYYVRVRVENLGPDNLARSAIPVWGAGSDDSLIGASAFTADFEKCPSKPLPSSFGGGAVSTNCLVFLTPKGVTLQGAIFRQVDDTEGITWTGPIRNQPGNGTGRQSPKGAS